MRATQFQPIASARATEPSTLNWASKAFLAHVPTIVLIWLANALLAVPVSTLYLQNAAHHKGLVS